MIQTPFVVPKFREGSTVVLNKYGGLKVFFFLLLQPALLRLKQHISEKSRTVQSQVITEEEAFDQVQIMTAENFITPNDAIPRSNLSD